jgi:hypothetical protein
MDNENIIESVPTTDTPSAEEDRAARVALERSVLEAALPFLESAEMREYLISTVSFSQEERLHATATEKTRKEVRERTAYPNWADEYIRIIWNSRAPLHKKAEAVKSVAGVCARIEEIFMRERKRQFPESDYERKPTDYGKMADAAFAALRELTENATPGAVFLLQQYIRYGRDSHSFQEEDDRRMFTRFDATLNHIKAEKNNLDDADDCVYYELEKWIPVDDGKMTCALSFNLSADGDVWSFDATDEMSRTNEYYQRLDEYSDQMFEWIGDLRLPVPFDIGDIFTVDCRPFAEPRHAVILEVGDNYDCCSVQSVFMKYTMKGEPLLDIGAVKHNSYGFGSSPFSALLRAQRYFGELPEEEKPLGIISAALKKDPASAEELGKRYLECIFEKENELRKTPKLPADKGRGRYCRSTRGRGRAHAPERVTWEMFRDAQNL